MPSLPAKPSPSIPELEKLESTPASNIKKLGWKTMVEAAKYRGPQVVTNHDTPEVVVVEARQYAEMVRQLKGNDPLEMLRRRFDRRLKALLSPDAPSRLRDAFAATTEEIAEAANKPGSRKR